MAGLSFQAAHETWMGLLLTTRHSHSLDVVYNLLKSFTATPELKLRLYCTIIGRAEKLYQRLLGWTEIPGLV